MSLYFTKHNLNFNIKETELVIYSEKFQGRNHKSNLSIILDDKKVEEKPQVKYLEVRLDYFLNFQIEVKNMLRKMACEIKTLQLIKKTTDNQKSVTFNERFSHKYSALPSITNK